MEREQTPRKSAVQLYRQILRPERTFYALVLIYGIAVSALTLSVPLSVQVLISTVANSALPRQVLVLALILLLLLLVSGLFIAIQTYVMELFERRFFSRTISEVMLRLVYARFQHMESINRDELVNRYFDIMTVHKSVPPLLAGGSATAMQATVGIAVTSFYHPAFLLLNGTVVLFAWLVFRVFDYGASSSMLELSDRKYAAASWLETLSRSNNFFKSRRAIDYALRETLDVREHYIAAHRRHFRFTFAQIVGFLGMYALTSAVLLGVGGWLVISAQLTIGQLVAAELILSAIFYGLSRMGYYLELYYDLYAAMSKLSQLYAMPTEQVHLDRRIGEWTPSIRCEDAVTQLHGGAFRLDFEIAAGERVLVETRSSSQVKAFTDLVIGFDRVESGRFLLDGHEIDDFNVHDLRDEVHVIDDTLFPECSIADYLAIAGPDVSRGRMRSMLERVALDQEVQSVPDGLDQTLTPYGYPLSPAGVIKLKIAHALLCEPKIIVLSPQFDMLSHSSRVRVLEAFRQYPGMTVVCFTHRRDLSDFDRFMYWDFDRQRVFDDLDGLVTVVDEVPDPVVPGSRSAANVERV